MKGLASDGTCPAGAVCDTKCNDNIGGKLTFSGDLNEGLLKHIGFKNGGFCKNTQLLTDLQSGTSAAAAYAANKIYYDRMMNWKISTSAIVATTPANAGATVIPAEVELKLSGVAVFRFPEVAGKFATAACSGASCNSDDLHGGALTAADLHLIAIDPIIYHSTDPSIGLNIPTGDVTVFGGEIHGKIDASTAGTVRLTGLKVSATGDVKATNSKDIFVASTTNHGKLDVSDVAAALYNVSSDGHIVVDNSAARMWGVNNLAGGNITVTRSNITLFDSGNAGTINFESGHVLAYVSCANGGNTGTITLGAGATGAVSVGKACVGIVTDNSNGGVTFTAEDGSTYSIVQDVTMGGVTVAALNTDAKKTALANSIADSLALAHGSVTITSIASTSRRRMLLSTNVKITYKVTVSSNAGAVDTKDRMAKSTSLLAAIKNSAATQAGVTASSVTATSAAPGAVVSDATSNGGSLDGDIVDAAVGITPIVGAFALVLANAVSLN
jgi:hypothetical protein